MPTDNNKSEGWNIIGRSFWNIGHTYIREDNNALNMFLENISSQKQCCIIGASGVDLIKAAMAHHLDFCVIDFSRTMCEDLAKEIHPEQCQMFLQDVILDDPKRFAEHFHYILTDQVINTFSKETVPTFFSNMSQMLKPGGELRTIIKIGYYDLDQLLIEHGRNTGTLHHFFDETKNTINYANAEQELSAILVPHEQVPKEVLVDWYMGRGEESRFDLKEIDSNLINSRIPTGRFEIIEMRPISNLTQSMYFRFQWLP